MQRGEGNMGCVNAIHVTDLMDSAMGGKQFRVIADNIVGRDSWKENDKSIR